MPAWSDSGKGTTAGPQTAAFLLCPDMEERKRALRSLPLCVCVCVCVHVCVCARMCSVVSDSL